MSVCLVLGIVLPVPWGSPVDAVAGGKASDRPMMVFEGPAPAAGPVLEGDPVRQTIRIGNRGQAPLKLVRLRPWKGTRLIRADRVIPPGTGGGIELELATLGAGPRPLRGITIATNEAGRPGHRIAVDLTVTPQIQATPDRVCLSGFAGQELRREIFIRGNLKQPLRLSAAEPAPVETIAWDLTPSSAPGQFRLAVRSWSKNAGTVRSRIRFTTNYPQKPFLTVPILVRTLDAVQAVPRQIDFGTVVQSRYLPPTADAAGAPGKNTPRPDPRATVFVRLSQKGTLRIQKAVVEGVPQGFPATIHPVEPGRVYRIDVAAEVGHLHPGAVEAALAIHTDHPSQPIIRVPLRIMVR